MVSTALFSEIFALRELKKRLGIPIINYCGSTPVKRKILNGKITGFELLQENRDIFDVHVAISECTSKYLLKEGIEAKVIIYAGVNPDEFLPVQAKKEKIIMYSGRFHHDKGADLIPDIVEEILKKDNNAQFIIAGYGSLNLSQELRKFRKNVSLKTLYDNHLKMAYRRTRVYFQPSRFEAFCVSVVEAMASGCNIVYSGLPNIALREVVADAGIPIDKLNPKLYAEKISESLKNGKALNQAAIERVRDKFDIQKKAEEWINLLNNL